MVTETLFIAHTPYHILLSLGMAEKGDHLVILADFSGIENFEAQIEKHYGSIFSTIRILPGRMTVNNVLWRRVFLSRRNKKHIRQFYRSGTIKKTVIFNDSAVEGQYAAYLSCKLGIPSVYTEDGLVAYVPPPAHHRSKLRDLAAKVLFGRFYQNGVVMGTSRWVTEAQMLFPTMAIPDLNRKCPHDLGRDVFNRIPKTFVQEFTEGVDDDLDAIVVLPHSEMLKSTSGDASSDGDVKDGTFLTIIKDLESKFGKVGVKYHPRETEYFLGNNPNFMMLPSHIPMELIYLKQRAGNVKLVVSALSTAVYTARYILGEQATIKAVGIGDHQVQRFFEDQNIEIL